MAKIHARIESARGCGFRKPGGMYLVAAGISAPCCKLPFALSVCPCCGAGIKQARGFTWIHSDIFCPPQCSRDGSCPMAVKGIRMGLMWVGEKYYPSHLTFTREAAAQGISKRIAQIPRDLVIGSTWVALAHPRAVVEFHPDDPKKNFYTYRPGIFSVFIPSAIEYVITGKETEKKLDDLAARGITLVDLITTADQQISLL